MEEEDFEDPEFEIADYDYVLSTIGNAYFSGLDLSDIWNAIMISHDAASLDAAVEASIRLLEIRKTLRTSKK